MSSLETIAVLAGVPLVIIVVTAAFTLGPLFTRRPRYQPGQDWNYPPVWWTADPHRLYGVRPLPDSEIEPDSGGGYGGCGGGW